MYCNCSDEWCQQPTFCCYRKRHWPFLCMFISTAFFVVVIPHFFVHNKTGYSQREIDKLKQRVERIMNSEEKTNSKLGEIESLLAELKKKRALACLEMDSNDTDSPLKSVIVEILDKYSADKTGRTDYALESAGGRIVSIGASTETYSNGEGTSFFGIKICDESNGPQAIIQPGTLPGECWAFRGSRGSVVIKLIGSVAVDGVSLEHMSKSLSPTGVIDTAPKEFSIWGLQHPSERGGCYLGKFAYNANGPPLQFFPITTSNSPFRYIKFKVHSNHGNPDFTCVYRLRVHGKLSSHYKDL